jgi:hypothetical protein
MALFKAYYSMATYRLAEIVSKGKDCTYRQRDDKRTYDIICAEGSKFFPF